MFFLLVLMALVGCAEENAGVGVSLELHLPGSLSRTEGRRARFERRVTRLELRLQSQSGQQVLAFGPADWGNLTIPDLGFPTTPEDRLRVQARVWDMQRDGTQRAFPALTGSVTIKARDMAEQGPTVTPVRLSLRVPVSEYD